MTIYIDRIRIFLLERWVFSWNLPRVLTNLSMAFCQGQQACISGHTLSLSLQNCKVAISVLFISWLFLTAPLLPEYRLMSTPSLNHLSAIQCSQVKKRYRNASIIDVISLFNQSSFDYGTHRHKLFTQTDSSWGVREYQRFVVRVELRRFLRHRTNGPATASIWRFCSWIIAKAVAWREAGGMLQGGWNFYSQWHSFQPQTEKGKLTLTITQKITP